MQKPSKKLLLIVTLSIWTVGLVGYYLFFDLDHGTNWSAPFDKSECGPDRSFFLPWEAEVFIQENETNEPVSCEYVVIKRTYYCDAGSECNDAYNIVAKGYTTKNGGFVIPSVWKTTIFNETQNHYICRSHCIDGITRDGYDFQMNNYQLADKWLKNKDSEPNTIYVVTKK